MDEEITKLQEQRNELVQAIYELDPEVSKVEIHELHGEISKIDRKIHAIDPSKV